MKNKTGLVAPCGLDCFNCEVYEENLTNEMTDFIHQKMGVPKKEIPCKGCHQQDGRHFHLSSAGCATYNCSKEKGVNFCCDCGDFPCSFLAPLAEMADKYPHNMKVYNLCRIKKIGVERWIEEEAGTIRKRYFTNKFVVGRGQVD